MRRILLNRARDKKRHKRHGARTQLDLERIEIALETPEEELIAVDEAIERLAHLDQPCADLVKLRFFAGLTLAEAADALGIATYRGPTLGLRPCLALRLLEPGERVASLTMRLAPQAESIFPVA